MSTINQSCNIFNCNAILGIEGLHRAINTPQIYADISEKFYCNILGLIVKGKIRSLDAIYMPWTNKDINQTYNCTDSEMLNANQSQIGAELVLANFYGVQFVYSLCEKGYSQQLQMADKSHVGLIFDSREMLSSLHNELSNKIDSFNKAIQEEVHRSNGVLNLVKITPIQFDFTNDSLYPQYYFLIEDMYYNKFSFRYIEDSGNRLKQNALNAYEIMITTPRLNTNETKKFYTEVLGAKLKNKALNKLTMDFHGIHFQCELDENFERKEHDTIEPAHYGFNVVNVELLNDIYEELSLKINIFNNAISSNKNIHLAKIYPISRRKINNFCHDAFFISDMYNNFLEIKCFYKNE